MLNRLLSFVGACGLLLAVTAMMPIAPAYAQSATCTGTCDADDLCANQTCEDTDGCNCHTDDQGGCDCE